MGSTIQDLRLAVRLLRKSPEFAAVSIAVLALGIGGNAAIFTLVNRIMLRPLPYPEPDRLMVLSLTAAPKGSRVVSDGDALPWSYPKYRAYRAEQRTFADLSAFGEDAVNLSGGGGNPERVRIEYVSGGYFSMLGIRVVAGRLLGDADDAAAAGPAAVIGAGLAARRFGTAAAAIGRTVSLNGVPVTIAGVAPADFSGLTGSAVAWVPLSLSPRLMYDSALSEAQNHWLQVVGRRATGVSVSAARNAVERAGRSLAAAFPLAARFDDGSVWGARSLPLREARRDPGLRRSLIVLFAAVGAVLLLACSNLAALLLARGAARRHEIAVRLSLGATAGRIRRQLLTESALLAALGGAIALPLATWGSRALVAFSPTRAGGSDVRATELIDLAGATVDLRVFAFTAAVSIATGIVFGLVPAWHVSHRSPADALRDSVARGTRRSAGRSLVVAGEIALALVLVLGAGLLARTFAALARAPLGFEPDRVLTFSFQQTDATFDSKRAPAFHTAILERVSAIPGVRSAGLDLCAPLSDACNRTGIRMLDGRQTSPGTLPRIGVHLVSPGYFATLSIPLRAGRLFTAADRAGSPRVVIVDETAARKLWPDGRAVGRRIGLGQGGFEDGEEAEVVGVVADVRYGRIDAAPTLDAYMPDLQYAFPWAVVSVRAWGDPAALLPAVRATVRSVDPLLPVDDVRTLRRRVADALSGARFAAALLGGFALFAVALAALGIYGLLARSVAERSREIGIRMALGASRSDVLRMMLRWSSAVTAAGIAAGMVLFAFASRALAALLFGVRAADPATIGVVVAFVAAVAVAASLLPAARASRIDPVQALRES